MPRMRRAAIERRQRPQLALGVWQYITGQRTYDQLTIGTRWNLLVLPRGREYWDRIREAVENGDLEVSEEKIHRMGDEPLLKPAIANRGQRPLRQERSEEAMELSATSEAEVAAKAEVKRQTVNRRGAGRARSERNFKSLSLER